MSIAGRLRVSVSLCLILPSVAAGQIVSESDASVLVGCYGVEVGEWSVEVEPEVETRVPARLALHGPPVADRADRQGGHVRTNASFGGTATARSAAGEDLPGWSWSTRNARSVRIAPARAGGVAILAILRDADRLVGRAVPVDATLADARREDFEWAPITLIRTGCAGEPPRDRGSPPE